MASQSKAPDITERTIIDLSGRLSTYYDLTGNAFDVAIAGMPFIMAVTDSTPYKRQTAEFRAQRVDQMRDPGEHTLAGSGYWTRSQSSWHYGEGINYTEPMEGNDTEVRFRYKESYGVNVWTPGEASLLHKTTLVQPMRGKCHLAVGNNGIGQTLFAVDKEPVVATTTATTAATGATTITVASTASIVVGYKIVDGANIPSAATVTAIGTGTVTISNALTGSVASGTAVTFMPTTAIYTINSSQTSSAFVSYSSLNNKTILAQTSDGHHLYIATTSTIFDIDLSTGAVHDAYTFNAITPTIVEMKFVKSRVIAAVTHTTGSAAYELLFPNKGSGASINISTLTPISGSTTVPLGWVWDGITEARTAIYIGGYIGDHSSMFKLQVDNTGALGTLITAATFPRGEVVLSLYGYLGTYIMIGTNKGARVAQSDSNGDLTYGPLVYHNENGVYDFEARDSYVWCSNTAGINTNSGTTRINLAQPITLSGYAQPISTGVYARATDVFAEGVNGRVDSVRIYTDKNLVAFSVNGSGVWIEHPTDLVPQGEIITGKIRFDTMENKAWKRIRIRTPKALTTGEIEVFKVGDDSDSVISILDEGSDSSADIDLATAYNVVSPDASFKLLLGRSTTDATTGAVINGIAVKALPTPTRARILQIPLFLYDKETDKNGVIIGYEGFAKERLNQLENIEAQGETVTVQDFNAGGDPFEVVIEQVTFTRSTPSARNYTGFGGIVQLIARTVV